METDKLIESFTKVVQEQDYVFNNPDTIKDIPSLQEQLAALENITSESLAEVIRLWYLNHVSVRDAVLVTEREIARVKKSNPANQENLIENSYRIINDELRKLVDKNQQSNQKS